ncbi:MAG: HAD-IC family P-type ATPase, partial [Candidatus Buchananbacteria bacterium]|nr:HAD-IC family P-type ATPase [Candidatus Buchananbacteria bacterium]
NTIVGFIQEYKAEKTLEDIKKRISFQSTVLRNGQEKKIDSSQVAIGDILILEAGDRIPADGRIFELNDFQVNEASLTGESLPIDKELGVLDKGTNLADRKNMVYMGTVVTRGRAKIVVTGTGTKTHLGEIASLVKETEKEKTPLQLKLSKFSKILGIVVLFASLILFIVGVILGQEVFEMFETAVAVAVAAIPEGLLVGVTIILTVGMQRILKKKALVRRLVAAETLGSTSVICSDKTGTLTIGKMRTAKLLTGYCDLDKDLLDFEKKKDVESDSDHDFLIKAGVICNNSLLTNEDNKKEFIGDPTETALLKAGIDSGYDYKKLRNDNERLAEVPFSTEIKFMATLNKKDTDNNIIYLKGAPEKILNFCSKILVDGEVKDLSKEDKDKILDNFDELTYKGLRVLASAYKLTDKDKKNLTQEDIAKADGLIFIGVFALRDPLRKEAKDTIDLCQQAGIKPIIITGDHRLTVKAIANEIGIETDDENIIEGNEMDELSDKELEKRVKEIRIYARVSPKHKLRIIDAWQKHNEVVAMLGDGVNDAPALKTSDIGVAVGSGTDVAKGTADIVLLDDNFKTIVDAVKQGRIIFDNIRKVLVYLLADSFSELILISGALIYGWFAFHGNGDIILPITALQILYINIITDGFPYIALTFEPGEKDVMKLKPRQKTTPILDNEMKVLIFIMGIMTDLILFGIYFYMINHDFDVTYMRTFIFTALAVDSLFYVFSVKSLRKTIFHINIFSNRYLLLAVAVAFGLQLAAIYTPFMREVLELTVLNLTDWIWIIGFGLINVLFIELGKYIFIFKEHHKELFKKFTKK